MTVQTLSQIINFIDKLLIYYFTNIILFYRIYKLELIFEYFKYYNIINIYSILCHIS